MTKPEVRLDDQLQARLLEAMREEQLARERANRIKTWVLTPIAVLLVVVGVALAFSDDLLVSVMANVVATGIFWMLWRIHREKIRSLLGLD